uniref:Uncharacterized protein n=1 Tax=Parastrongyloides trichosuri TaxID=131310 RepID=A0A0N4ZML5_PARTI
MWWLFFEDDDIFQWLWRRIKRKCEKNNGKRLIFGSSTPRDLSYLNNIPYKHRIYNAEIPRPVIITNPSIYDDKKKKSGNIKDDVEKIKKKEKKELKLKNLSKVLINSFNINSDEEEDSKSLSPYSEPDLSNDRYNFLPIPLSLSNTNNHRSLNETTFRNSFNKDQDEEEKTIPLEILCISQCNHPAYNVHDSPLKEQIILNDKGKLLLNDSQQMLFDHNFEEYEERKVCKTRDLESLRDEIEKINFRKMTD